MKRMICVLMIIASLFLVSCGKKPAEPEKKTELYASSMMHAAVELPSRVLLMKTGGIWYYSKADGESYKFCFNPLCRHKWKDKCAYVLFGRSNSLMSKLVYCEENGRIYTSRGQMIYSMNFDASDVKLECALGENGDLSQMTDDASYIRNLRCRGHYIYFIYNNDDTGNLQVIRYDASNGKTEEMTSADTENIIAYEIANGYIYFKSVNSDNVVAYYTADYDFGNRQIDEDPIFPVSNGMTMPIYDGKYFYDKNNGKLYAYDPTTHERIFLSNDVHIGETARITAVHDGYVYFIPIEPNESGDTYSSVYRVAQGKDAELVLDFPECSMLSLNFITSGVIIDVFSINFEANGKSVWKGECFIHYDIADDGKFINPKPIGDHADDAELIEYLKGLS